jgi:hypothetical protein
MSRVEVWPVIAIDVPVLWLYLAGNVLAHYMCIRSVFVLASECSSLTVTLVLTLRKFLSLLASLLLFNQTKETFTACHWLGTALVFAGTLLFTNDAISINFVVRWTRRLFLFSPLCRSRRQCHVNESNQVSVNNLMTGFPRSSSQMQQQATVI